MAQMMAELEYLQRRMEAGQIRLEALGKQMAMRYGEKDPEADEIADRILEDLGEMPVIPPELTQADKQEMIEARLAEKRAGDRVKAAELKEAIERESGAGKYSAAPSPTLASTF